MSDRWLLASELRRADPLSLPPVLRLMQDPETDVSAYMHWDQSGKLLIIPDEKSLVENVCKVHFAQQNITSFVSRLYSRRFL